MCTFLVGVKNILICVAQGKFVSNWWSPTGCPTRLSAWVMLVPCQRVEELSFSFRSSSYSMCWSDIYNQEPRMPSECKHLVQGHFFSVIFSRSQPRPTSMSIFRSSGHRDFSVVCWPRNLESSRYDLCPLPTSSDPTSSLTSDRLFVVPYR